VAQRLQASMAIRNRIRLWGIATTYERVWERRQSDQGLPADRGRVRWRRHLSTPIQMATRLDPMGGVRWDSLEAAQRLMGADGRSTANRTWWTSAALA